MHLLPMPMKIARCFGRSIVIALLFILAGQLRAGQTAAKPQPPPIVRVWGILFQVMECFEEYVANKALSSIHNDDSLSSSAVSILLIENQKILRCKMTKRVQRCLLLHEK
jgi:hypothetical protein